MRKRARSVRSRPKETKTEEAQQLARGGQGRRENYLVIKREKIKEELILLRPSSFSSPLSFSLTEPFSAPKHTEQDRYCGMLLQVLYVLTSHQVNKHGA